MAGGVSLDTNLWDFQQHLDKKTFSQLSLILLATHEKYALTVLYVFHVKVQRGHEDSYRLRALVVEKLHNLKQIRSKT